MPVGSRSLLALVALASFPVAAQAEQLRSACALAQGIAAGEAGEPLVDLPFRTIEGRIYVDVTVNGRGPFVFALDTGASGTGRADATLVAALGLPPDGESQTSDGVASATVDTVRIASLALGGLVRQDVSVIARDYRSRVSEAAAFSGILGRAFFADGLLAIDFPAQRLRFFASHELSADQPGALPYLRAFRVPVTLGTVTTHGNIDTGADVTLAMPPALYEQLQAGSLEPAGNASLTNTRLATSAGRLAGPVRVGGAVLSDVPVRVIEGFPELLVGAHALKGQRVLIDQRHQTIAVCPATGER
jgi:predicted aspartyl protease